MNASSFFFISKAKAGESAYYSKRQRGECIVYDDSARYIYRKWSCVSVREFKDALQAAFGRLDGAYPVYNARG